jgi:hypothetical protein
MPSIAGGRMADEFISILRFH